MHRFTVLALLAACSYDVGAPSPTVDAMAPALVCNDQLVTTVTVTGSGFAPTPTDVATASPGLFLPDLTLIRTSGLDGVDGGPEEVALDEEGGEVAWVSDGEMTFEVRPERAFPEGIYDLEVRNLDAVAADGEPGTLSQGLAIVPPPTLGAIEPQILCDEQADVQVTLTGAGFLVVEGALPSVSFGDQVLVASAAEDCFDVGGPMAVQSCGTLQVTIPAGTLAPGVFDVVVTNPDPAGCVSTEAVQVEVVPPPELATVEPEIVCVEQESALALTGSGFLVLGGVTPTVHVGDWSGPADAADGCVALTGPAGGETCTSLTVTVPTDVLATGVLDVSVTNPPPADCVSTEVVQLDAVGAPVVTELVPPQICVDAGDVVLGIVGEGFLQLADGTLPTVSVDGLDQDVLAATGCSPLGPSGASTCTGLDVAVPAGTFTTITQDLPVVVTNPPPADCADATATLDITGPPVVTGVEPNPVCDTLQSFVVTGEGFQAGAEVYVDGAAMPYVTWLSDTQLEVGLTFGQLAGGLHDVLVVNPDGCDASAPAILEIVTGPVLFFVDPPVIYSEITTQASLFVSGVTGSIVAVWIEEDATGATWPLDTFTFDGQNTITAEIPAADLGLPAGPYTVYVEDDTQCVPFLDNAFEVKDELSLSLISVEPGFAWELADTPVDVRAVATADLGAGESNFVDLPRVYLNPTDGSVAEGLRSVAFQDEELINAVIPPGLPPGTYDVIVVNPPPGNEIGLLPAAITISALAPPYVDSVAPSRCSASAPTPVVISGEDFRNPIVDVICQEPGAAPGAPVSAPVTSFTATSISATVPSDTFSDGTVCVVRVTNDDATSYDYSAISVGSPSGNLFAWSAGLDMNEARRAPVAVAGRATDRARYLYAIGGDDGASVGASSSIEVSPLDSFGNMRDWRFLPDGLPEGRTLAGSALVDRFVYVVGGHNGLGAVDEVWRAQILDPLDTPELDNLALSFGAGYGLDGGTWIYRISAVFAANDPVNPGGEGLPSDPIVVSVPDVPDKIHLELSWTPVASTVPPVGYNVYRVPVADAGSGTEEFLGFVAGTTYLDVGDPTDPGQVPLPDGAFGAWHLAALLPGADPLDAAREGACVVSAADPVDPDIRYLYVAGGRDGNGVVRDTISYVAIDAGSPDQPVGAFQASANTLGDARWMCGGFLVDDTYHTIVAANESWVYFGPGSGGATVTNASEAGLVLAGGELGSFQAVGDLTPGRSGYAAFAANNFLYVIGGYRNAALDTGSETSISLVPVLDNWNSLGGSTLSVPRELPGSAIESAVVFAVGGDDGAGPLTSTDFTNF